MSKPVAVIGCGPAGMMAAHAASQHGYRVEIFAPHQKSPHGGAQYLHTEFPDMPSAPCIDIRFTKVGYASGYATKVYGYEEAASSWDEFDEGVVSAYPMGPVYDQLFRKYSRECLWHDELVTPSDLQLLALGDKFSHVFCSAPLPNLCLDPTTHRFNKADIILEARPQVHASNIIIYNGQLEDQWYRTSNINGVGWTEYPMGHPFGLGNTEAVEGAKAALRHTPLEYGFKPLSNDCDCHPSVHRIGRFGQWKKGVLAHSAYFDTAKVLQENE